jgi:hypothetical protein
MNRCGLGLRATLTPRRSKIETIQLSGNRCRRMISAKSSSRGLLDST